MRLPSFLSCLLFLSACGSEAVVPASSASDVASSTDAAAATAEVASSTLLPENCSGDSEDCLPPASWVHKLCSGVHPEVALHMFRGGSPWKRLYSRATAPAYNGTGGP